MPRLSHSKLSTKLFPTKELTGSTSRVQRVAPASSTISSVSSNQRSQQNRMKDYPREAKFCERRAGPKSSFVGNPDLTKAEYISHQAVSGQVSLLYGQWDLILWGHDRLEFESNLDDDRPGKLLHTSQNCKDIRLWGYLLDYRYNVHGYNGVKMFWNAILLSDLRLPTYGRLADRIWTTLLSLGLKNHENLVQILKYADRLLHQSGKRWLLLYDRIIEHFFVQGDLKNALEWHRKLFPNHPPGAARFRALFRELVHQGCEMSVLKKYYTRTPYRNIYSSIIPLYCRRGQYKEALSWHLFLLKHRDLPSKFRMVEPLVKYLMLNDKPKGIEVLQSLVESRILGNTDASHTAEGELKLSGETMNLIHGKTFGIPVKKYNDELGARWFATTWVSIDTAISTVHALGIQEIGPLSLQAISLREQNANAILHRIQQLRGLEISIGTSLFSKAVEHFARTKNHEFLQGLLTSDQHPDQLENTKLQHELLAGFARACKWSEFGRTLEIQSLASRSLEISRKNLIVKVMLMNKNISMALRNLAKMQIEGTPIKLDTISHILAAILQPRRRSKGPSSSYEDVNLSIRVLNSIMRTGSHVPSYYWREIIRRLGMLGRLEHLQNLTLSLVSWYSNDTSQRGTKFPRSVNLSTQHPRHPVRQLIDNNFQRAVIAWGFIHPLKYARHTSNLPNLTYGLCLLKQLHDLGAYIDGYVISRALIHRLMTYFGPRTSTRLYNQHAQPLVAGRLANIARQIDEALGDSYFAGLNLPNYLHRRFANNLPRLERRQLRRLEKKRRT